jgi:hypothetical protein
MAWRTASLGSSPQRRYTSRLTLIRWITNAASPLALRANALSHQEARRTRRRTPSRANLMCRASSVTWICISRRISG